MIALLYAASQGYGPTAMQRHEYYLREFAMAKPPPALGHAVTILTQLQGEEVVGPEPEPSLHPLVVPLTCSAATGEVTGLLRIPGPDWDLPFVRMVRGGSQMRWLAASSAKFVQRAAALAEAEGAGTAAALRSVAESAGVPPDGQLTAPAAMGRAGAAGKVLLSVGPSMMEYEARARDATPSLSTLCVVHASSTLCAT